MALRAGWAAAREPLAGSRPRCRPVTTRWLTTSSRRTARFPGSRCGPVDSARRRWLGHPVTGPCLPPGWRSSAGVSAGLLPLSPGRRDAVCSPTGVPPRCRTCTTARAGLVYAVWPSQGLSVVSCRVDGIPCATSSAEGTWGSGGLASSLSRSGRRAGRGRDEFTLSLPIRLRQDFRQSLFDRGNGKPGGGDLADLLVFAGFTHRF